MWNCGSSTGKPTTEQNLNARVGIGCGLGVMTAFFGAVMTVGTFATPDTDWAKGAKIAVSEVQHSKQVSGEANGALILAGLAGIAIGLDAASKLRKLNP